MSVYGVKFSTMVLFERGINVTTDFVGRDQRMAILQKAMR